MKILLLLRHAKSSWKTPGMTDALRPLNDRGMHDAPLMGKLLRKMRVSPEMIISSPATRAITTATLLADKLRLDLQAVRVCGGL